MRLYKILIIGIIIIMSSVLENNYTNFNFNDIQYIKPIKIRDNIFISRLNYRDNKPFSINTPLMKILETPEVVDNNLELKLQFSVNDKDFFDLISQLDLYNIEYIYQNSNKWFQNTFTRDIVNEFYESRIYNSIDDTNNMEIPYLFVKLPLDEDSIIVDDDNNPFTFDKLKKNMQIKCVLDIKGLVFLKKRVIADINTQNINIQTRSRVNLTNYLMENQNKVETKDVIDRAMVNELAKVPSLFSDKSEDISFKQSTSKDKNSIFEENNLSLLNEKRDELNRVLDEADRASKLAEELSLNAKNKVNELRSIAESISGFN